MRDICCDKDAKIDVEIVARLTTGAGGCIGIYFASENTQGVGYTCFCISVEVVIIGASYAFIRGNIVGSTVVG